MGGGKSGSTGTQQQNSTVSIPPEVLARYNSVNATAEGVAQAPFNSYTGAFVAPVNTTQQGGINQITGAANWINPTYSNTVNTISAGLAGSQPYYGAAGNNIQAGLAGGQGANQTALNQYGQALGAAQPYNTGAAGGYGMAAGLAGAGTGAVNPTAVDSNAIGQYMSPYNNAVVQSTMALLGQQQQQQQNQLKSQQILGGSFGGDRSGIDRAVLSGQQNLASANVASGLYNQNYSQALGAAQQQQSVGLGAAQANRAALQTGANQFTGLGQAVQGLGQQVYGQGTGQAAFTGQIGQQGYGQALGAAGAQQGLGQAIFGTNLAAGQGYGAAGTQALQSQLAQGQAQLGAGTVQQQTEQADLTARYNQFLQEQAYPFQTTQFLANIAEGTGALSGSTTSANNYSPQPFFSDRRLKENIKTIAHTKAGIPIVQYNYKGRPGTQIGLIAQDVEKRRPEAVGLAHGYKTVDYERALRAGGGGVGLAGGGPAMMIYHIGGSVDDDDAGRGFGTGYADGGAPGMDPNTMAAMLAAHQAMYPGAAGRMGMDSGPRGMQLHQPSGRSLMKADLIKPQDQQSQTRNAAQGLSDVAGAGKSAAAIYDMGKDAAVGSAAKGTPGTAGYTPATGGLAGTGGQWSPENGWFGKTAAGLGAANSNTPSAPIATQLLPDITPPAAVDASTIADASSGLVDDALSSAWAWRGGRQGRDVGGPTLADIGSSGMNQALLVGGVPPEKNPYNLGSFAGSEWARNHRSGAPTPAPAPVAQTPVPSGPAAPMTLMGPNGSANGATGSGGDTAGGVSGTGGVGGSATGGAGGSAAAGVGGDDGGTYREGGVVHHALTLARRPKRYASGGMPYGDAGDGYIPDDLYEPIDAATLAKEQKGMESKTPDLNSGSGSKSKSSMGKSAGSLAGGLAGMYFGPMGGMVGSGLGGLLGGALDNKRGGRIGYQEGGYPVDDRPAPFLPTDVAEDLPPYERGNVIPFPDRGLGVARSRSDELPPFESSVKDGGKFNLGDARAATLNLPPPERNPERPAARELDDKAAVWREPVDGRVQVPPAEQVSPGLNPPAPEPATTIDMSPSRAAPPVPGLAPPRQINEPPGFRAPGMQPSPSGSGFDAAVNKTFGHEGGFNARDANGAPVNMGINQAYHPNVDVKNLTKDQARDIYKKQYWDAIGGDQLDPKIQALAFDTAVISGPQKAKDLLAASGGDPAKFLQMRTDFENGLIKSDPEKYGKYAQTWANRRASYGADGQMALNAQAPGLGGAGGSGLGAPKDFLDRAGDWYDRNEKRIVPALAFLGSMLSSPSRTLAGSIGSGLVGGAQALQTQQQLGQGQQRIGITQNAQFISVLAQLRQMQSARAQRGLPPDPVLDGQVHAIMDKIAQSGNVAPATSATMGLPSEGGVTPVNQPAGGGPGPAPAPATLPAGPAPTPLKSGPAPAPVEPTGAATKWGPMPSLNLAPVRNQIDPDWDPQELQKRADQTAALGDAAGAARLQERAAAAQARMESVGTLPGKNGGSVSVPGFTERQIAQQNVAENQKTLQTENAAATTRQTARMQLGAIKELLQSYESGTAADVQAEAQGVANLVGIKLPVGDTMNAQKFQEFVKNAYGIILSNASLNKNETDQLRGMVDKTFASPTMQPGANRKILAETEAGMNLADKRNQDFTRDVAGANHLSPSQWSNEWRARPENQLEPMVEKARKETPVMGDVPAKRQDLEEGVQYILRPTEAIKLFAGQKKSNGEPLTADDIKKQFGDKKRMRVVIKNGLPELVQ